LFALRFDLSLVNFFVAVSPPFKLGSQSVAIALSSLDLVLGCVSELTGGSVVRSAKAAHTTVSRPCKARRRISNGRNCI
jgi:hypothetical protein